MIEINDTLKPILNRKVHQIASWAQKLLEFEIDKDVKRRYKDTCFLCQRRAKEEFKNTMSVKVVNIFRTLKSL